MVSIIRGRHTWGFIIILICLVGVSPVSSASKKFEGRWVLNITMPEAPGSNTTRTFTINLDAGPRGNSLHGRATIIDSNNISIGGVWRQSGKKIVVVYELPCLEGEPCATLVLHGKMKDANTIIKKGDVTVMWDATNDRNPALHETSNGSFSADRLP